MPGLENEPDICQEEAFQPQFELKKWLRSFNAAHIYAGLKEKVYGQDDALRKASVLIYSFLRNVTIFQFDTKFHFMIEGTSGCGKTTFAKALKSIVPCPVICADATQVTASGYRGIDASDLVRSEELDKWWGCGILILDEVDKLMEPGTGSDNFHRQSLETFLKILDGGDIQTRDAETIIHCNRLLVIGMGAFTPARERSRTVPVQSIGFGRSESFQLSTQEDGTLSRDMMTDYCGSEQFMGRFLTVLHFNTPGKEVYRKIVKEAIDEIRWLHGCDAIQLTDSEIGEIIDTAIQSEYGCRGIRSAIWERLLSDHTVITEDAVEFLNEAENCRERLMCEVVSPEELRHWEQIYA